MPATSAAGELIRRDHAEWQCPVRDPYLGELPPDLVILHHSLSLFPSRAHTASAAPLSSCTPSSHALGRATGYVDFWVRQSRLADDLDRRLLQALIPWFQSEWAFAHVAFICLRAQERQVRLYEEAGLRYLYTLKPRQAYLGDVVAYASTMAAHDYDRSRHGIT